MAEALNSGRSYAEVLDERDEWYIAYGWFPPDVYRWCGVPLPEGHPDEQTGGYPLKAISPPEGAGAKVVPTFQSRFRGAQSPPAAD
jgi:hypothetical protein